MSVQVVTIANHKPTAPYYIFDQMLASVRKFGHDPIVLGWGERWGGLGNKPRILKRGIESGKVSADTIVFVDAFDVILAASPDQISEKFNSQDSFKVVWGAERNFWHRDWSDNYRMLDELRTSFPDEHNGFNYLNSGFCVAKTEAMLSLLNDMDVDKIPDDHVKDGKHLCPCDQSYYGRAYCKVPQAVPMGLDTKCEYVLNLHSVKPEELEYVNDGVVLKQTGAKPMSFHFNGGSKSDGLMEPILKHFKL